MQFPHKKVILSDKLVDITHPISHNKKGYAMADRGKKIAKYSLSCNPKKNKLGSVHNCLRMATRKRFL